jgi:hypothetical protein
LRKTRQDKYTTCKADCMRHIVASPIYYQKTPGYSNFSFHYNRTLSSLPDRPNKTKPHPHSLTHTHTRLKYRKKQGTKELINPYNVTFSQTSYSIQRFFLMFPAYEQQAIPYDGKASQPKITSTKIRFRLIVGSPYKDSAPRHYMQTR